MICKNMEILPENIQRTDLLRFIEKHDIQRITFHYVGLDGQLKDLVIPLHSKAYTEHILASGERVDGSSLFKGIVPTVGSDLYVVPYYPSAFINPFDPESLDFMCRYVDSTYARALYCPDNILHWQEERLKKEKKYELWAFGELEFYLLGDPQKIVYDAPPQSGYQASTPFSPYQHVLQEMVQIASDITGLVKYGHSEVGFIPVVVSNNPKIQGKVAAQYEIELLPAPATRAADALILAKWVVRNVASKHGLLVTFAPKIADGNAGTGMHFHLEIHRNGINEIQVGDSLSSLALQCIGGLCDYAPTLSAFGNTIPSSYFRLVPHQEAPTQIYWGDLNRSALIRLPLGWTKGEDLATIINPSINESYSTKEVRQTIEFRSPDGSAFIHLLLAGIIQAFYTTFTDPERYLKIAETTYVSPQQADVSETFKYLPKSCHEAASFLNKERQRYAGGIPDTVIDWLITYLESHHDAHLQENLDMLSPEEGIEKRLEIMHQDFHIR
ncbi:MAG: glutamine synthetase beta-grasp domain-containing protein [Candidatus Marinimicrobia bacterium]|nr:glutamine synthetase beta-grasp domain-containing protein [Candidatus Neomarinimicrobiota bacterium]